MSKVKISGSGYETVLEVDGVKPQHLMAFRLLFPGPGKPTVLQMDIDVTALEVETKAEVMPPTD